MSDERLNTDELIAEAERLLADTEAEIMPEIQPVAAEPVAVEETPELQPVYQSAPQPAYQPVYQPVYQATYEPEDEPEEKKKKKKKLPLIVRMLLGLMTFVLSLALTVSLSATIVLLDANAILSRETIEKAAGALMNSDPSAPKLSQIPGDTENLLADMIYEAFSGLKDAGMNVTKEGVIEFVEDGTIDDYLVEELSDIVEDFIKGTSKANISVDEIEQILEDNEHLVEKAFDIVLDEQTRQEILDYVRESDIDSMIQEQIVESTKRIRIQLGSQEFTVEQLLESIRPLFEPTVVIFLVFVDMILAVAIFFTKQMRLGGTLLTLGGYVLSVGLAGTIPILIYQFFPEIMAFEGLGGVIARFIGVFIAAIAPIHYTFMIIGGAMMVLGIICKCVIPAKSILA